MVVHAINSSRGSGKWISEFEASLVYNERVPGQPGVPRKTLSRKAKKKKKEQQIILKQRKSICSVPTMEC